MLPEIVKLKFRRIQYNILAVAAVAPLAHGQHGHHIANVVEVINIGKRRICLQGNGRAGIGIAKHMLCLGVGFSAAAEPTGNHVGAGCATAVAGEPDNTGIRAHAIVGKVDLQQVINLLGGLLEAFVLNAGAKIEIAEPLRVLGCALDGNAVNAVGLAVDGVFHILICDGIRHIIVITNG